MSGVNEFGSEALLILSWLLPTMGRGESLSDDLSVCPSLKVAGIDTYVLLFFVVVLYGCETWSLTLREEQRLRVFENRVLRRIFGPKRDGVTGEWRKLHNEQLNDLYCSPHIVRVIK